MVACLASILFFCFFLNLDLFIEVFNSQTKYIVDTDVLSSIICFSGFGKKQRGKKRTVAEMEDSQDTSSTKTDLPSPPKKKKKKKSHSWVADEPSFSDLKGRQNSKPEAGNSGTVPDLLVDALLSAQSETMPRGGQSGHKPLTATSESDSVIMDEGESSSRRDKSQKKKKKEKHKRIKTEPPDDANSPQAALPSPSIYPFSIKRESVSPQKHKHKKLRKKGWYQSNNEESPLPIEVDLSRVKTEKV